jgi:hypothetical protein
VAATGAAWPDSRESPAPAKQTPAQSRGNIEFGPFRVSMKRRGAGGEASLAITYGGQKLRVNNEKSEAKSATSLFSSCTTATYRDTPEPGLAMLVLETYSGGAHCCFEKYLLVHGPDADVFTHVALAHGTDAPTEVSGGRMDVVDWSFA